MTSKYLTTEISQALSDLTAGDPVRAAARLGELKGRLAARDGGMTDEELFTRLRRINRNSPTRLRALEDWIATVEARRRATTNPRHSPGGAATP